MNVLAGIRAGALGLSYLPTKNSLAVALILKPHGLIDKMHQTKAAALTVAGAAQVAFKG